MLRQHDDLAMAIKNTVINIMINNYKLDTFLCARKVNEHFNDNY